MKLVLLDSITLGQEVPCLQSIAKFGELQVFENTFPDSVVERLQGVDIAITNKVYIGRETMKACASLKLICVTATGLNNIDLEAAKEFGITVKNVAGYSTESVAQHTFAMLLSFSNHIHTYDRFVKDGHYATSNSFTHIIPIHELAGKTFGIIGLGTIGKRVADIAVAFSMKVVYFSSTGNDRHETYQRLSIDELISTADVISIHSPLNAGTKDLLDYKTLSKMKPHAILLNTGRGGIVNETDLARLLDENKIGGACFDVFQKEPIATNNPLLAVKNPARILFTPHVAWSSVEARNTLMEGVVKNIQDFLQ